MKMARFRRMSRFGWICVRQVPEKEKFLKKVKVSLLYFPCDDTIYSTYIHATRIVTTSREDHPIMESVSFQQAEAIVEKWRSKKGNLLMILHEVQNAYGYIPKDIAGNLSRTLHIPLARIYEVLTFYHYFKLSRPGRYKISVCMGTACYLKGSPDILHEIKSILNVDEGQTTKDGLFYLESVRCLGCCGLSPVISVNETVYGNLKKADVVDIISKYSKEA